MQLRTAFLSIALGLALSACTEPGDEVYDGEDVTTATEQELIAPTSVRVTLVANTGVTGTQRVNFAVPLPRGALVTADNTRVVRTDGVELPAARKVLATWPDGSLRSVQIQIDVNPATVPAVDVQVGTARTAAPLTIVEVSTTLLTADGTTGPKVWAVLPDTWTASSEVAGPMLRRAAIAGTALDAFQAICNYTKFNTTAFNAGKTSASFWLFDRPTGLYRGYAYTGSQAVLQDAYREAAMYRAGITGTNSTTRIAVPGASGDLKYHYTQGMAIHYLLTGDTRFREAAENVAIRAHDLWLRPGFTGSGFWTERHAGFALLAYEWAAAVSDDRAATFTAFSDTAVTAYAAMQDNNALAFEADARCFAHSAAAHDEPFGYNGCSPWMSAIMADGLDAYARRNGSGTKFTTAKTAIVELGRMIARHGRDTTGKPFYWMGAGVNRGEVDAYNEHWAESAYTVAMAWAYQGKTEAALKTAADQLMAGTKTKGAAGQLRSYNWQCRASVAAPFFLK